MPGGLDVSEDKTQTEYYKGRAGCQDVVKLLTMKVQYEGRDKPDVAEVFEYYLHNVTPEGATRPIRLGPCRENDCVLCDSVGKAPGLEESGVGDPWRRSFASVVLWLTAKDHGDDNSRYKGRVLIWRYGGDKYRQLKALIDDAKEAGRKPSSILFNVTCPNREHDAQVQKLTIIAATNPQLGALAKKHAEEHKAAYKELVESHAFDRVVKPPSNADMKARLQRILKSTEFPFGDNAKDEGGDEIADGAESAEKKADDLLEEMDGEKKGGKPDDDLDFLDG
jgi:hypothetical protein